MKKVLVVLMALGMVSSVAFANSHKAKAPKAPATTEAAAPTTDETKAAAEGAKEHKAKVAKKKVEKKEATKTE